ncbi:MAG: glycosyltransferase [Clostridia bacterium]
MKKILIFYGSYGGGHLSAAKSIKECIEKNYTDTDVVMLDCIEYVNKIINKLTTKAYADMAKNAHWIWKQLYYNSEKNGALARIGNAVNRLMAIKLNKLFKNGAPDLIISTHPFSSQMCAILKSKGKINSQIATILTDYAPHRQWLEKPEYVNYFFVAHDGMVEDLVKRGIDRNKIYSTGIPLSNRFLAHYDKDGILKEFGLAKNKATVLFFAGGEYGFGKDTTFNILKTIIEEFDNLQVVAIAGKNVKMQAKFETLVKETDSEDTVKVLSYTNKVPELMSISDIVISKPGGLTTTESLASGLPIIVINPIPGQEEENAEFLEQNGVGIWLKKNDNIKEKLREILSSTEKIKEMKINARLLSKKNSTADICKILLEK